jgi:hypothetical protein
MPATFEGDVDPQPQADAARPFIAPSELQVDEKRVYYEVEEEPEAVVIITAFGIKERNRVRIAGGETEP